MEQEARYDALLRSFTPSAPVDDVALFAGRQEQRTQMLSSLRQAGQHVMLFGERGVGKTSLANIFAKTSKVQGNLLAIRVNCDSKDDFGSVWRKVATEVTYINEKQGLGFGAPATKTKHPASSTLPDDVRPQDVRKLLESFSSRGHDPLLVIDEFDRVKKSSTGLFADTIKMLSDHATFGTIILVGVADSVDALMKEHASVERALVQVIMPRMSDTEVAEIVSKGLRHAEMTISKGALAQTVWLARGLPHYAHLLGQNAGLHASENGRALVSSDDVRHALKRAVDKAQESIKSAHYTATTSPRRENLYAQVLLACALAHPDQRGYFAAADVRDQLGEIMGKRYEIPAFSQHLNDFCDKKRGNVLDKVGSPRRYRFRFVNPLMQPYVIMDGISKELVSKEALGAMLPPGD